MKSLKLISLALGASLSLSTAALAEDLTIAVSWNDDTLDREAVFLPHLLRTVWASAKPA